MLYPSKYTFGPYQPNIFELTTQLFMKTLVFPVFAPPKETESLEIALRLLTTRGEGKGKMYHCLGFVGNAISEIDFTLHF